MGGMPFDGERAMFSTTPMILFWAAIALMLCAALVAVRNFMDARRLRASQQRMRENDERFQLLARATNDVMWDWNLVNDTVWWNEGICTRFGYCGREANASLFWREHVHPDDLARVQESIDEALEAGQDHWQAEYRFRKADETYATVLDRGSIVRGADLRAVRMMGAMMDVTEARQMGERLAHATRVSSLGRIATAIAHEFNNVLMGIQPNLELVKRRGGEDLAVPVGHIQQSVKRGKRITDEILRFTRSAPPRLECVDVTRFLDQWSSEIAPSLGRRIKLTVNVDEADLYISADPQQIAEVLTNLAVNAREAITAENGEITISVERVRSYGTLGFASIPTADRFAHFSVRDNGSGMSASQLAHVFEPLFTTKKGGTGLGLAVSYQIVTSHDGYISAESHPGEGSTFHILLPQTLPILHANGEESRESRVKPKVLFAVDDTAARNIRALLAVEGMEPPRIRHHGLH